MTGETVNAAVPDAPRLPRLAQCRDVAGWRAADRAGKHGAAELLAECEAAPEAGTIAEAAWYRPAAAVITQAYLAAETPWARSGKSGDAASRRARGA